ncbi:MAG: TonB-dependent receptor [Sphingomonadales bacterium]|nr:TonB-dependent receptor [Sphingomonadales bacterium]MDE2170594.1 TonB-dependent receptor [Sphingomonadales bacterium]
MNRERWIVKTGNIAFVCLGATLGTLAAPACAQQAGTSATSAAASPAQSGDASSGDHEITVTALRRSESINKIGVSIQAMTGSDMVNRGLTSTDDLVKVVPSLNIAKTALTVPVYTLRGVGFYDTALASTSTVSVYTDEVPLPYPAMTTGASLDLERVEVLKGPQGTLYGSNSTGGAINYISAKPASTLGAGGNISFGRFDRFDMQAYVTGPVSDTLRLRLSAHTLQGGDWQYNYTRDQTAGDANQSEGRFLLDWKPDSRLSVLLNVNGWYNKSASQFPQTISFNPLVTPNLALLPAATRNGLINQPIAPANDRAADWPVNYDRNYGHDDSFYQISARVNYQLADDLTLTSLTAYDHLQVRAGIAAQGTTLLNESFYQVGGIKALTQELRVAGKSGRLRYIVGGNFLGAAIHDSYTASFRDSTATISLGLPLQAYFLDAYNRDRNYAGFGNLDYELTPHLTLQGGLRYTSNRRDFNGCLADSGDGYYAAIQNKRSALLTGQAVIHPAGAGDCVTLTVPGYQPGRYGSTLSENNVSWRAGVNWTVEGGTLLYANISRGYKQGAFPTISASVSSQFEPAKQESLLAYEAGFKAPLFGRKLQVNGAFFYYDYSDKQILGRVPDAVLNSLQKLVNIPKSHIIGGEMEIVARPLLGLTLTGALTYVHSRIDGTFVNYDNFARQREFAGEAFPFTPEVSGNADVQYEFASNGRRKFFLGSSVTYNGSTYAALGQLAEQYIKSYALLDLRAGIASADDRWRLTLWGKNVTNTYYYTNAYRYIDYFSRLTGQPVTYGASFSFRY